MSDLIKHLPGLYKDIKEMQEITDSENSELTALDGEIQKLRSNQYIKTLTVEGVEYWEGVFNILPDTQTESLNFRRDRILNRMTVQPPFTKNFLRQKLDSTIGKDKYSLSFDYDTYTIYIESSAQNQLWYNEIRVTINAVKPCNMVFINKPFTTKSINISNEISYSDKIYNYRLGVTWRLGQKAFTSIEDRGVVKVAETASINNNLLYNIAAFTANDVAKIVINGNTEINSFVTKISIADNAIIEYTITPMQATEVNTIQLFDINNNLLDESNVYIPVAESAVIKHDFKIKEGV